MNASLKRIAAIYGFFGGLLVLPFALNYADAGLKAVATPSSISGGTFANPTFTGTVTATGATIVNGTYTTPTLSSPTISGTVTGGQTELLRGGIPFIYIGSGSVAAGGGISGITALPFAYPHAYCYFPANALATTIAAGWYYCTFSTTTAGTAFLNTYTSGTPTVPGSPTAVTDGKGAFTSGTAAVGGPTYSLAGNTLTASGRLVMEAAYQFTNNGNGKTLSMYVGGTGGTAVMSLAGVTTQVSWMGETIIQASGAVAKNVTYSRGLHGNNSVSIGAVTARTLDFTASQDLVYAVAKATATDNVIIDSYRILLVL